MNLTKISNEIAEEERQYQEMLKEGSDNARYAKAMKEINLRFV